MDALGVIYAVDDGVELSELTRKRALASVPIWGRYRIIDFVLSNMVNSGIQNVSVIIQNHYNSLLVHLGSGNEWDLDRKREGLFIFPPYASNGRRGWYNGSTNALNSIMGHLRETKQKYVIIAKSNILCNMTYNDALNFHIEKRADVTAIYKEDTSLPIEELRKNIILQTDEHGRVWDAEIEPASPKSYKMSMGTYIIDKSLLEYLLEECIARGKNDFLNDFILNKMGSLKIYGQPYNGYVANINSIGAYYRHSMEMLSPDKRNELFFKSGLIYTRVRDEVPVMYTSDANVQNCLVADGCVIEGEVTDSILFRGVKVRRGAKIKNSIILSYCDVMENSILENVILDKEVIIKNSKRLTGQENYPVVVRKGSVI